MKKIKWLFFDVDDTMVDTEGEICRVVLEQFGFTCPPDVYLCPLTTGGHHAQVLREARFMVNPPLLPGTAELFKLLPALRANGFKIGIITHRGYHEEGETHTNNMLNQYGVRDQFDDVIVIDFNKHPDKVAFLESYLDEGETFTLFDDRPRFDRNHPLPDNVVVFDRTWNRHFTGGQRCYNLFTFVGAMLEARLARREKLAQIPRPKYGYNNAGLRPDES